MKLQSLTKLVLLSSISISPFAAHAAGEQTARACVDTFVAEHLGGRQPHAVQISGHEIPRPLVLRENASLHLTAVDKSTGRTIATVECSTKRGLVTVKPVE